MKQFLHALPAVALFSLTPGAHASQFSDTQKAEMGTIIREYLLENPDVIFEAVEKSQDQQRVQEQQNFQEKFLENREALIKDAPFAGNPDGDVVVVEFFDYNCGYCHRALSDVMGLLESDPDVKVVFKDMPILSPQSQDGARWAIAAGKQGQYFAFHKKLMDLPGSKDMKAMERIAEELNLDLEQMRRDAESDEVKAAIESNLSMARVFGIGGTPAFIIEDTLVPGYMGLDALKKSVADARAAKQAPKN